MTNYPYAVLDGRIASDVRQVPVSCHRTRQAAERAASRLTRDGNDDYRVVQWAAPATARAFWPDCEE